MTKGVQGNGKMLGIILACTSSYCNFAVDREAQIKVANSIKQTLSDYDNS